MISVEPRQTNPFIALTYLRSPCNKSKKLGTKTYQIQLFKTITLSLDRIVSPTDIDSEATSIAAGWNVTVPVPVLRAR